MDWNKFMSALQEAGVEEITLKFRENKVVTDNKQFISITKEEPVQVKEQKSSSEEISKPAKQNSQEAFVSFREQNPNWHTVQELSEVTQFCPSMISGLIREYNTPSKKIGKRVLYDTESFWASRQTYEDDIVRHDGQRQGNVKFIANQIAKLVK